MNAWRARCWHYTPFHPLNLSYYPMALGRGLSSLIPNKKTGTALLDQPFVMSSEGRLMEIPIRLIDPNPYQPRKEFGKEELRSLADSIAEKGLLQPIVVSPHGEGRYHLVVGERRLRATELLGREKITAMVRSTEDQEKLELAIIENVQRKDLNPMERSEAYYQLREEFGLTIDDLVRKTGESKSVIGMLLHFMTVPKEMQQAIRTGRLNYKKARALTHALGDKPDELMALWREAEETGMTSSELEQEAPRRSGKKQTFTSPTILEKEKELEKVFGTRVRISSGRDGTRYTIGIDLFSQKELFEIIDRLLKLPS